MRRVDLSLPEFFFVVGTRAMLGAGVALLFSGRMRPRRRRQVGLGLLAAGALTTIPAAGIVFREKVSPGTAA